MHNFIFKIVRSSLESISRLTGLTYNEINIILYYFMIPFSWLCLSDIIFGFHYLKIAFVIYYFGFYIGCRNFRSYSDRLFERSISFLNYFNRIGSNYVVSSVWICVSLPTLIYTILIILILKKIDSNGQTYSDMRNPIANIGEI